MEILSRFFPYKIKFAWMFMYGMKDNRKTLYCSQSNENYGISNNELNYHFKYGDHLLVIEPLLFLVWIVKW